MSRDAEKLLMKELDQALAKRDDLAEKAVNAHRFWADANAKHEAASADVRGIISAIASLRSKGEIVTDTHRRNIEREAYDAKKETPVA